MASLTPQECHNAAEEYFPLAKVLAAKRQRELPPGVNEVEDLVGVASVALVSCLRRFDSSRGMSLSHWISFSVRKAFLDYSRAADPLSQDRRTHVKMITELQQVWEKAYGRSPTLAELTHALGWEEEEVCKVLQDGRMRVVSLEANELAVLMNEQPMQGALDPGQQAEWRQQVQHFRECVAELTEQERIALQMKCEERSLIEIASALGLRSEKTAWGRAQAVLSKVSNCMQKKGWL